MSIVTWEYSMIGREELSLLLILFEIETVILSFTNKLLFRFGNIYKEVFVYIINHLLTRNKSSPSLSQLMSIMIRKYFSSFLFLILQNFSGF